MRRISIVGFGRFGQTLYRLLKDDFEIVLFDKQAIKPSDPQLTGNTSVTDDLATVYASDVVFYAVPISEFEGIIETHKPHFQPGQLLIDVLAVKLYPEKVFAKYLAGTQTQAMLTHPMFGPDSSQAGFDGLSIITNQFMADGEKYEFWKNYFTGRGLRVVELTPSEHDKMSANSIGLTHFLGRLLEDYHFAATPIDTLGAKKLLEIKEQVCNDSWQMFNDLQHYNPYTEHMRLKLGDAYDKIYNKLLPAQANPDYLTIGIQGGKGSFNEEAVMHWLKKTDTKDYRIKYLYTTEKVLAALHSGEIDRGQFAIHNSVGGIVDESIEALSHYKFQIIEEFAIIIAHALMTRKDIDFSEVTTVMAHPQVFAQCKHTFPQKYPHLKQVSGEGELIDHANVAKQLAAGKLPPNIAVMGSKVLADLYDLKVIEDNLQDAKENYTSFLIVGR